MKQYLLTFKTLKEQHPTPSMYYKALEYLCMHTVKLVPDASRFAFEADKEGKLHFHVVVYASYVRFKQFVEHFFENDMYFYFVEINSEQSHIVDGYLNKARLKEPNEYVQNRVAKLIEACEYPFV